MATAVKPGPDAPPTNPTAKLLAAGTAAAAFLVAGCAVALYGVPQVWEQSVAPLFASVSPFAGVFLRVVAQVAVVAALVYVGGKLAGTAPPKGLRGAIFLVISAALTVFFVARAIALNVGGESIGAVFGVAVAVLAVIAYRLLASAKAVRWMHAIEEMGWFHTHSYKRTQGLRLRRYTIMGILLIGLSGVYALMNGGMTGSGNLTMRIPGVEQAVTVLTDVQYSLPLLLAAAVLWFAWRAVNVPEFADFLIATEAEMNKVSWSTRKRLIQDTIVVLVTTALLTLFLLGVDLFWGWLLSRSAVGVLPSRDANVPQQQADIEGKKTQW